MADWGESTNKDARLLARLITTAPHDIWDRSPLSRLFSSFVRSILLPFYYPCLFFFGVLMAFR